MIGFIGGHKHGACYWDDDPPAIYEHVMPGSFSGRPIWNRRKLEPGEPELYHSHITQLYRLQDLGEHGVHYVFQQLSNEEAIKWIEKS